MEKRTIVKVSCQDQVLKLIEDPIIASGGRHENFMQFTFCEKWNDFVKTAVFYIDEAKPYYSVIDNEGLCEIPHEMTDEKCTFNFGVFGVFGEITRTSAIVKYYVDKGPLTENLHPSDPTPDIWEQLLAKLDQLKIDIKADDVTKALGYIPASEASIAVERERITVESERINQVLSGYTPAKNSVYEEKVMYEDDGGSRVTAISNGLFVVVSVHVSLDPSKSIMGGINITGNMNLFKSAVGSFMELKESGDCQASLTYEKGMMIDTLTIDVINKYEVPKECECQFIYLLKEMSLSFPEIIDARIGIDGFAYGSIGDAIREQIREIIEMSDGELTDEEIKQAIDKYLEENPVQSGATEDEAKQISKNKEDILDLLEIVEGLKESEETGISTSQLYKFYGIDKNTYPYVVISYNYGVPPAGNYKTSVTFGKTVEKDNDTGRYMLMNPLSKMYSSSPEDFIPNFEDGEAMFTALAEKIPADSFVGAIEYGYSVINDRYDESIWYKYYMNFDIGLELSPVYGFTDGNRPIKGIDYWTESDKAEIKSYVDEAILGGEW